MQGEGVVLAGLDVLQFRFFLTGGNHQQVGATDGTVVKTILDDVVLPLYDVLERCGSFEAGTGGGGIPIDGIALVVNLVEGQLGGQLGQFLISFRHLFLGYQRAAGIERLRQGGKGLISVGAVFAFRTAAGSTLSAPMRPMDSATALLWAVCPIS